LASSKGILNLFSTVHQDNTASKRALRKLGYRCLSLACDGDAAGYQYHHFGPASTELELYSALSALLAELGDGKTLVPLAAAALI
jgi:hypothetical protein